MRGISENIMLGQFAHVGTGAFDLVLDKDALQGAVEVAANFGDGEGGLGTGQTPGHVGRSPSAMMTPGQSGITSPSFMLSPTAVYSPLGEAEFSPTRAFSPGSPGYNPMRCALSITQSRSGGASGGWVLH
jgi:DNA-directed RNA polymerase II subunit RPB1